MSELTLPGRKSRGGMTITAPRQAPVRAVTRPGHLSKAAHVGVYVVLFILVAVDYILLHQSLVLLNSAMSTNGAVGPMMYVITAGFSMMMITLPHVAAKVSRRVSDWLLPPIWRWFVLFIGAIWLGILVLVTTMRMVAQDAAGGDSALEGLEGVAPTVEATGIDLLHPESLMALLTAFFLTATGIASYYVTWLTTRPLLHAVEQAEERELAMRSARDEAAARVELAIGTLESAQKADAMDLERLDAAKAIVTERLSQLRSDVATILAEHEADPQATSRLLRELNARHQEVFTSRRGGKA
jgi:hypothetical protein